MKEASGTELGNLSVELPGLDCVRGLELFDGNSLLYLDILQKFYYNSQSLGEQIIRALKNQQSENLLRLIHNLKGTAGNIGALDTMDQAQIIVDDLRAGRLNEEGIIELLLVLEQALKSIKVLIEARGKTRPGLSQLENESLKSKPAVLVIDDSILVSNIITQALGGRYQVTSAACGREGLSLAISRDPDIILLDVILPDLDGYEVLKRLKDSPETRSIPVIFMSALAEPEDQCYGLSLGAVDYIVKPLNVALVREKVERSLNAAGQAR